MEDCDKLQQIFDELGIKYECFVAGLDPDDPLVIEIHKFIPSVCNDHSSTVAEINFEFDQGTGKYRDINWII